MPEESSPAEKLLALLEQSKKSEDFSKSLLSAMKSIVTEQEESSTDATPPAIVVEQLKTRHKSFTEKSQFSVGQIVKWKPNLKNRRRPRYNEPAVVVAILDKPFFDSTDDAGTTYFHEPLDLGLGVLGQNGDFLCYYFDSRRFEPFE